MARGAERQKKAQNICIPKIREGLESIKIREEEIKEKIALSSVNREGMIASINKFCMSGEGIENLESNLRNGDNTEIDEMVKKIRILKTHYNMLRYDMQECDNLLRTVKNPIEKRQRVVELKNLVENFNPSSSKEEFNRLNSQIEKDLVETKDKVNHMLITDMPWLIDNIAIKAIAILGSSFTVGVISGAALNIGIAVALSPLVLNPIGLGVILGSSCLVSLIYLTAWGTRQRRIQKGSGVSSNRSEESIISRGEVDPEMLEGSRSSLDRIEELGNLNNLSQEAIRRTKESKVDIEDKSQEGSSLVSSKTNGSEHNLK